MKILCLTEPSQTSKVCRKRAKAIARYELKKLCNKNLQLQHNTYNHDQNMTSDLLRRVAWCETSLIMMINQKNINQDNVQEEKTKLFAKICEIFNFSDP